MADMREQEISAMTQAASKVDPLETEVHLEDDSTTKSPEFKGAMLELNGNAVSDDFEVKIVDGNLSRNRPHSQSMMSRKSTTSTVSKASLAPNKNTTDWFAKNFFCRRPGAFENAVDECKSLIRNDLDGEIKGAWVLTEIDHWNTEREKIVMITDATLVVIKYDFVSLRILEHKRIFLHMIDSIMIGDFHYPKNSMLEPRTHGGIRLLWNKGVVPSFGQRWNPWCTDIPWLTFTYHPLIYNPTEAETITYNVDDCYQTLFQQIKLAYGAKGVTYVLKVIEGPIEIESYGSLASVIHNQSHIGFSLERNGMSF